MDLLRLMIDFILHIDQHLKELIEQYGALTYAILFIVVFCETGLIVTPLLPGDSLLFAAGTFAGLGAMNLGWLCVILFSAAVLGDMVNYWLARTLGNRLPQFPRLHAFTQPHIQRTEEFFQRHGGKTIVIARFMPIVRTFAPFVAGVGKMNYGRFGMFNVLGAALWVGIFVPAGFFFGNLPFVRKNFTMVILGVIVVSLLPLIFEYVRGRVKAYGVR